VECEIEKNASYKRLVEANWEDVGPDEKSKFKVNIP
jgi:hypothetical protein